MHGVHGSTVCGCDMGTKPIRFGMPAELAMGKMTMEVIEEAD